MLHPTEVPRVSSAQTDTNGMVLSALNVTMKNTIAIVLVDIGTIYLGGQTNNWNIFNIDGIKYKRRDKVQNIYDMFKMVRQAMQDHR